MFMPVRQEYLKIPEGAVYRSTRTYLGARLECPGGMFRRAYLKAAGGIAATATLAGCTGGGKTGTLATKVSDQPGAIEDFETLVLRITKIYPKPTDGNRKSVDIDDVEVDLVKLQGGESREIGSTDLDADEYEFLQLEVGAVVEAKLKGGGEANVTTPGEAPLKFEKSFEIREGETTTFVADFTPIRQGQAGGYVLKPVADEVRVIYEGKGTPTQTP